MAKEVATSNPATDSGSHFSWALQALRRLGGERVLILKGDELRASEGFETDRVWNELISMSVLEQARKEGTPVLTGDAQLGPLGEKFSVAISGIRSVLCVPYFDTTDRVAGILYADTRSRVNAFGRQDLESALAIARRLEYALYRPGVAAPDEILRSAEPAQPLPPRPTSGRLTMPPPPKSGRILPPSPQPPLAETPNVVTGRPQLRSLTIFYRSAATMFTAGLSLNRILEILSRQADDPAMGATLQFLSAQLQSGHSLSAAMARVVAFSRLEVHLVKVGEKTGTLHRILEQLAIHREKSHRLALKVQSALVYPAFILAVCLVLVVLVPSYLMQGQFQMMRSLGVQPMLLTRVLMALSTFLSGPLGWATVLGALALGASLARKHGSRPELIGQLMRIPLLAHVLRTVASARFARALALTYRSGLPILEALPLAAASAENPLLESWPMVEALKAGATLTGALEAAAFFPPVFLRVVTAAQESGQVDDLMEWIAGLYEIEVESGLDQLLALLEPTLMMGLGLLVGVVLLATLLPMVHVLQSL